MIATAFSAAVALACGLACCRRLAWAVAPVSTDPALLLEAFKEPGGLSWRDLRDAMAAGGEGTWERDLWEALGEEDETLRLALMGEQRGEFEWAARRWERVPRVCASVATSAGFLCACLALIGGLSIPDTDPRAALGGALDAFAVGLAGMSFCVAVHATARLAARGQVAAVGRLLSRLEALAEPPSLREPGRQTGADAARGTQECT